MFKTDRWVSLDAWFAMVDGVLEEWERVKEEAIRVVSG